MAEALRLDVYSDCHTDMLWFMVSMGPGDQGSWSLTVIILFLSDLIKEKSWFFILVTSFSLFLTKICYTEIA